MEQITPIFTWAFTAFSDHEIVGSEYLGYEYTGGTVVNGISHEDVENLSFADEELDLIVSNEVFEHVPNPTKGFTECARVLKSGGLMLMTVPFNSENDASVVRAILSNGQVQHILQPIFHGNPISEEGSLVFTDFGWDLIESIKTVGFSDVVLDVYASSELGHLGGGGLVFKCIKFCE